MYNFDFVIPSVLILIILFCYFVFKPKVPILRYRVFLALLISQFLVVIFDVLSSFSDEQYEYVPIALNYVLNMGFFVFYIARIYVFFSFTMVILHLHVTLKKSTVFLMSLVCILSELIVLSSFFTHAVFYIDAGGYHRGDLYYTLYICFLFYLILSIILICAYRRQLTTYEFCSALGYNFILIVGNVVRFLFPNYLVMNTFCLLAIMVLFISFVNTDLYTNDNGAFNRKALHAVLDELMPGGNCRILGFTINDFFDLQEIFGTRPMAMSISMITDFLLDTFRKESVFYLDVGRFVISGSRNMNFDDISQKLKKCFSLPWTAEGVDLYLDVGYVTLESDPRFVNGETVIEDILLTFSEINDGRLTGSELIDLNRETRFEHIVSVKRILNHAIEENRIEVFLQPLISAHTGELAGAEALARLRDETGKLIPPNEFIPLAEKNGQISQLSDQVLNKVCSFMQEDTMKRLGMQFINVNLSAVQFQDHDLSAHISGILDKHGISPDQIHLEITEETMVEQSVLREQMVALQKAGFRFALDDYGSGYSNMLRVTSFPFADIKLDMEIVRAHCENPDSLLPTIVGVFKERGFFITAEGIEDEHMAQVMSQIGCDLMQGYYYSPPIPMDAFIEKYSKWPDLS